MQRSRLPTSTHQSRRLLASRRRLSSSRGPQPTGYGPQLRQPRRDGGHNLMTRHVSRPSFVQAIGDPIDRRRWYCPPAISPARPERRLHGDHCPRSFINFDTCDTGHSCRGVRIRTVPDLDRIHVIPNPDLKVSGELSAMCSTDAGTRLPQLVGIRGPSDRRLRW